jgi:hypothetical protein
MNMVEKVAAAVRLGRFERNGMGKSYDPEVPLHETEIADARAAMLAMREGGEAIERPAIMSISYTNTEVWRMLLDAALQPDDSGAG